MNIDLRGLYGQAVRIAHGVLSFTWFEQSRTGDSPWPFQRNSQSLRSEGLQAISIPKAKAAGVGIVEKVTFRQSNDVGQCSGEECSTSSCQEETPISKHRRGAQVYAESSSSSLGESMQEKVVSQVLDGSKDRVQTPPRLEIFSKQSCSSFAVDTGSDPANAQGRHDSDGHLQKKASHHYQFRSVDFIDLTEGEDPVLARLEGEDHFNKNFIERQNDRKF